MSKRNRQKRKLRKLIQQRLREVQSQPTYQTQPTAPKFEVAKKENKPPEPEMKPKEREISEEPTEEKKDIIQIHPDFRKIGILVGILGIIMAGIFIINMKTPLLNNIANKLFNIFQNS